MTIRGTGVKHILLIVRSPLYCSVKLWKGSGESVCTARLRSEQIVDISSSFTAWLKAALFPLERQLTLDRIRVFRRRSHAELFGGRRRGPRVLRLGAWSR